MNAFNCDDIRQTLISGATLPGVCTTDEFNNGALPNANNVPLSILPVLAQEHLDKDDAVLIYRRAGGRAIMVEKILTALGFTNVTNIGGIQHYQHCH